MRDAYVTSALVDIALNILGKNFREVRYVASEFGSFYHIGGKTRSFNFDEDVFAQPRAMWMQLVARELASWEAL